MKKKKHIKIKKLFARQNFKSENEKKNKTK